MPEDRRLIDNRGPQNLAVAVAPGDGDLISGECLGSELLGDSRSGEYRSGGIGGHGPRCI